MRQSVSDRTRWHRLIAIFPDIPEYHQRRIDKQHQEANDYRLLTRLLVPMRSKLDRRVTQTRRSMSHGGYKHPTFEYAILPSITHLKRGTHESRKCQERHRSRECFRPRMAMHARPITPREFGETCKGHETGARHPKCRNAKMRDTLSQPGKVICTRKAEALTDGGQHVFSRFTAASASRKTRKETHRLKIISKLDMLNNGESASADPCDHGLASTRSFQKHHFR